MDKNKKDYLFNTLIFQFIVCAVAFGILFGLKFTGTGFYENVKGAYFDNLDENFISELKNTDESLHKEVEVNATADTTVKITEPDSKPNIQSDTTPVTEPLLKAQVKAEGGADYSVSSDSDMPSNVSVNSYTLNQRIFLPAEGEITSQFGIRNHPISGDLRFHAGVDIANDSGTPINAAFDGVVLVADYDEWNGYYLKISHDNEIMTVYCHCKELFVKKGDYVKAGEKIAEMGSTGSSTGPHLHFELRIKNISYDPETALNEAVNVI